MQRPVFVLLRRSDQPVNEHKQPQPDHVDEVPVPGHRLEGKVVFGREMPLDTAYQDNQQHGGTQGHMQSVEAGQHEEGRAVHAGGELQVQVIIGVNILVCLQAQEQESVFTYIKQFEVLGTTYTLKEYKDFMKLEKE